MAEETQSSGLATLGRIVSVLGYVWVGLIFFGGRFLAEAEIDAAIANRSFLIPAFILVAAGRAIKRRATPKTAEPESPRPVVLQPRPDTAAQPTPDVAATPPPVESKPKPAAEPLQQERKEVATSLEQVLAEMEGESTESAMETDVSLESPESLDVAPKTSEEMVEEAKHLFDSPPDSD